MISSPSIMLGYYKNQEATQEIITLDETGKNGYAPVIWDISTKMDYCFIREGFEEFILQQ